MKVCVVTVTYGDRFELLKQVIEASFKEGVNKVIVVDNASIENSRNKLKNYEEPYKDKMKVVYLDENTGSAGGFKSGLEEAYKCPDCEFIWLLDDDNMPLEGSLKALIDFWNSLEEEDKEYRVALLSYRFGVMSIKDKENLYPKNGFLGFHIKDIHKKIYKHLKKFFRIKNSNNLMEKNLGNVLVQVAPYGGFFFNKKILDKIGYPNEDFYLYADDYDWSYRITKNNGKIYIVEKSKIKDIEVWWSNNISHIETTFSILSRGDNFRVYYTVRNTVYFEINNTVNNKFIYYVNMIIYLLFIFFSSRKNLKIILRAIKDGFIENLGKL